MVSLIQSNYMGFGSGMVEPGTGIALHNRGNNFSLDATHPNCIAPGKRPYHTIIPGFLTHAGLPVGPFGVMGGFMQPQGHVQMVMNTVDFHLNPQAALDAPRWEWESGQLVNIEHSTPEHLFRGLAARGHNVNWQNNRLAFGRGQIIWRDQAGVLCGGTDGAEIGWQRAEQRFPGGTPLDGLNTACTAKTCPTAPRSRGRPWGRAGARCSWKNRWHS